MTNAKQTLVVLITKHPDLPLRIVIDDVDPTLYHVELEHFLLIDEVRLEKGLLINDYYYIEPLDFNVFKSYCIGSTKLGAPIPTDDEMKKQYEELPWEDIIYVHVTRNETNANL